LTVSLGKKDVAVDLLTTRIIILVFLPPKDEKCVVILTQNSGSFSRIKIVTLHLGPML
jgi:hypothetical protein